MGIIIFFPCIHFIIFSSRSGKEKNTFRQGGNILKAIFVPSRRRKVFGDQETNFLEIACDVGEKIESGQRSSSLPRYFLTGVVRVKIERR